MVCLRECIACQYGHHEKHVKNFAPAPPGVMGGAACPCTGECIERHKSRSLKAFDELIEVFNYKEVRKTAILSDCGAYRYRLSRIWDDAVPPVMFVGMNPSTADAEVDDPTIRKCVKFARSWGYGGLLMGNLFAFRSTDPKQLPSFKGPPYINPVGELGEWSQGGRKQINDIHLIAMAECSGLIVAAWGAIKPPFGWEHRAQHVRNLLDPMHALKITKDGHPGHPLYIRDDTRPIPLPTYSEK